MIPAPICLEEKELEQQLPKHLWNILLEKAGGDTIRPRARKVGPHTDISESSSHQVGKLFEIELSAAIRVDRGNEVDKLQA